MDQPSLFGAFFSGALIYAYWGAWAMSNIACTYFVYQAAIRRKRISMGIGPYWWALLTLIGGVWTLLIYWLIEHSTLSSHHNDDAP